MVLGGGSRLLVGVALPFTLGVVLLAAMTAVRAGTQSATGCVATTGGPPSAEAEQAVPAKLMPLFAGAERAYGVPWNVLAAINKVETDFGRDLGPSPAGAVGWMQFMPDTWARYGVDADGDGRADPDSPADAIFSAAAYLRAAGARGRTCGRDLRLQPRRLVRRAGPRVGPPLHDGAHRRRAGQGTADECGAGLDPGSVGVRIAPGANLPGRPLAPETVAFLARVAALYGRPLIVTTGTNHPRLTVDGLVSDHADGHAADLGMAANGGADDSPVGDALMTACLVAAGIAPARAAADARAGGLYTLDHDGLRIQCIWKTYLGGNHHNHVHIGARPL